MEGVTITSIDNGESGEYRAHVEGSDHVGRLTWVLRNGARVAEHTLVPKAIGGRGIAGMLVEALVEDARAKHFRIVPQCFYVAARFEKNPDWTDLRA